MIDPHRPNLLFSYAYLRGRAGSMRDLVLALSAECDVLIDSGAFTDFGERKKAAARAGSTYRPIELPEYIGACRSFHGRAWQYVALDVIRDSAASARNLQVMLDAGLRPMPVLLETDPVSRAADLVEVNDRICVAGGATSGDVFNRARYRGAFAASGRKAQIHALGYLRFPEVLSLPLASGDSSTFNNGQRWGDLYRFEPHRGLSHVSWRDLSRPERPGVKEMISLMRASGVEYEHMNDVASFRGAFSVSVAFTMLAYLRFQRFAAGRSFRAFLAMNSLDNVTHLCGVLAALDGDGRFHFPTWLAVARGLNATKLRSKPAFVEEAIGLIRSSKRMGVSA